jgi:hypothetical protein
MGGVANHGTGRLMEDGTGYRLVDSSVANHGTGWLMENVTG